MFYLTVIVLAWLISSLSVYFLGADGNFFGILLRSFLGIAAVILWDGLWAFLIRRMPEKYFAPMKKCFAVGEKELGFYRYLRIKKWKRFVPELGGFTGFHKDKLADPRDPEYLSRYLLEANYGVLIHFVNALLGFAILFLPFLPLSLGIPIVIVNGILSLMPAMILRSNTPALRRLLLRSSLHKQQ